MRSQEPPDIVVELYGMPRARSGQKEIQVSATTISDALAAIVKACPVLKDLRLSDGTLAPQYLLSLDGETFAADMKRVLKAGDRLLLLSADVGG